ncbi:MAG TPA: MBL fold metallo-hydrolase [Rhizomicrobium sp.]|nr:MBL fold metallo-hydrolase [Rhizomicrobium sp.]
MSRIFGLALASVFVLGAGAATAQALKAKLSPDLRIVAVDVEGGAATLFVTPEGKSLLIDSGWAPGAGSARLNSKGLPVASSADKIVAAAHALGLSKIDYFVITHYHGDHIGGFKSLTDKIAIDNFIDHGPNVQLDPPGTDPARAANSSAGMYATYSQIIAGKNHIVPKTGDALDIGSMHVQFISVAANVIANALPGGGGPNPDCAGVPTMERDGGIENHYSVSSLITFGKARIAAFGDLPWNEEIKLLCPTNKIGPIDLYFVTQHGMDLSSSPPTRALDPIVSIMANGDLKGGDEAPMKMIASYAHYGQAFWMLHYTARYPALNPDLNFIANPDWVPDLNFNLTATVTPAGLITITNGRNQFSRTYKARAAQ